MDDGAAIEEIRASALPLGSVADLGPLIEGPRRDGVGNWVPTVMGERYGAFVSFDDTAALHPLPPRRVLRLLNGTPSRGRPDPKGTRSMRLDGRRHRLR